MDIQIKCGIPVPAATKMAHVLPSKQEVWAGGMVSQVVVPLSNGIREDKHRQMSNSRQINAM